MYVQYIYIASAASDRVVQVLKRVSIASGEQSELQKNVETESFV